MKEIKYLHQLGFNHTHCACHHDPPYPSELILPISNDIPCVSDAPPCKDMAIICRLYDLQAAKFDA